MRIIVASDTQLSYYNCVGLRGLLSGTRVPRPPHPKGNTMKTIQLTDSQCLIAEDLFQWLYVTLYNEYEQQDGEEALHTQAQLDLLAHLLDNIQDS